MKRPGDSPASLDLAAGAFIVLGLAFLWARWQFRNVAGDLVVAEDRLTDAHAHARKQAAQIAELDGGRVTELERELGESLLELDEPAGADVDLRRGDACGHTNPALLGVDLAERAALSPAELTGGLDG